MSKRRLQLFRDRGGFRAEAGMSLVELLIVLLILLVVVAAIGGLFISASTSQIDQTKRHEAQQNARLALDALRREIRCANSIDPTDDVGNPSTWPSRNIRITLDTYCPTVAGTLTTVTWCTRGPAAGPWTLYRITPQGPCTGGVAKAGFLMTDYPPAAPTVQGKIFNQSCAGGPGSRQTLGISLPVDVSAASTQQRYWLKDDIVIRNAPRCP